MVVNLVQNLLNMAGWFFFDVIIPLISVPLALGISKIYGVNKKLAEVIKDGQLCFYSATTLGVLLRDLMKTKEGVLQPTQEFVLEQVAIEGFIIMLLMFSMGIYSAVMSSTTPVVVDMVGKISINITAAVILSVAVIRLTKGLF